MTSVHRRARDLAVLKSLGFVPAQVLRTVAWQATTLASVALVIGVPVGIALGRVVWDIFANQLGTLPEPVTPPLPLALMFPIAILAANAVAAIPGYLAARTPPALVLRTE